MPWKPRKHQSLLPPQNSEVYNPFAEQKAEERNGAKQLSVMVEEDGFGRSVFEGILELGYGEGLDERKREESDVAVLQPLEDQAGVEKEEEEGETGDAKASIVTSTVSPPPTIDEETPTTPSLHALATSLKCIYVPLHSLHAISDTSFHFSTSLHIPLNPSTDASHLLPPLRGHEVYSTEHLEDFIDVFRRRADGVKRVLDMGKGRERKELLGELEELMREYGRLRGEVERVGREREKRMRRKRGKMRRRRMAVGRRVVKERRQIMMNGG